MDNNNMNGGMPNINFGSMGSAATAPNGAPEQQPKKPADILGMKLKLGSLEIPVIALGAAALVVLIILISLIAGSAQNGNVKKALMAYTEDPEDVHWEKFYPNDIADAIDDYVKAHRELRTENYEDADIKILGIEKLGGKSKDLLVEAVMQFVDNYNADMRKRDVKVSNGYMVTFMTSDDGDDALGVALVIKTNGRYGVYNAGVLVRDY